MNRLDALFSRLKDKNEAALVAFLTLGDPDLATTAALVRAVIENGADIVEIGVPFSDPTADGPVLQKASEIGLRQGASLNRALEMVAELRRDSETPIVLYGYYNPIFHYGTERFARDAKQAGIDGLLVVDLPPDEAGELLQWTKPEGVHFVCLLAPTSNEARVRKVVRHAAGFIYYVSVVGVTGVRPMQADSVRPAIEKLRRATKVPIGVGFGITTPEQAKEVAAFADAAVVGTAIMRIVDQHRSEPTVALAEVGKFVRGLKDAMRTAR